MCKQVDLWKTSSVRMPNGKRTKKQGILTDIIQKLGIYATDKLWDWFVCNHVLHIMMRMNDVEANMPDQYDLIQAEVKLGGVNIQLGRDRHSLCPGNL